MDAYSFGNLLQIFYTDIKALITLFGEYAWFNQFLNVTIIPVRAAA